MIAAPSRLGVGKPKAAWLNALLDALQGVEAGRQMTLPPRPRPVGAEGQWMAAMWDYARSLQPLSNHRGTVERTPAGTFFRSQAKKVFTEAAEGTRAVEQFFPDVTNQGAYNFYPGGVYSTSGIGNILDNPLPCPVYDDAAWRPLFYWVPRKGTPATPSYNTDYDDLANNQIQTPYFETVSAFADGLKTITFSIDKEVVPFTTPSSVFVSIMLRAIRPNGTAVDPTGNGGFMTLGLGQFETSKTINIDSFNEATKIRVYIANVGCMAPGTNMRIHIN